MADQNTESAADRARRHQTQRKVRELELAAQAAELKQQAQSRLRDHKAHQAAEADTGLTDDDPRTTPGGHPAA